MCGTWRKTATVGEKDENTAGRGEKKCNPFGRANGLSESQEISDPWGQI
jgi:hypothetical protein